MLLALEIIATISGIACVYLQTREKILAWPFGIVSVLLAAIVYYENRLFSDVMLHVIYVVLNAYGWWNWANKGEGDSTAPILSLTARQWFLWGATIMVGCFALGTTMGRLANADLPYMDGFTTAGSLVAQYLMARKILQNWTIWIIVDVVAINVYIYKGLYLFSFLFAVYLVLCIKGYIDWRKSLRRQESA
jgi:nicotinamide mononucleotide transporter